MPRHVSLQLLDAVTAEVAGLPTTGANIFADRAADHALTEQELPALLCNMGGEEVDPATIDGWITRRVQRINIGLRVKSTEGSDDALCAMRVEVETALKQQLAVGPDGKLVQLVYLGLADPQFDGDSEQPVASAELNYTAELYTSDAETFIPDGPVAEPAMRLLSVTLAGPGSVSGAGEYPEGTLVTLVATPDVGALFVGWSGGTCSGTGPCSFTIEADTEVTATFELDAPAPTFSLTAIASGPGSVAGAGIYEEGAIVTLVPTPDVDATFEGWSGACSGTAGCTLTMTADMSVTALFAAAVPADFTLSTGATGPGAVSGAGTYPSGTVVPITATPNAGAQFVSWSGDCGGSGACSVTMDQDRSVTALFAPITFTLSTSVSGAGTVSGSGIYNSGTVVSVVATPTPGNVFAGWSGACSGTGACSVTMDANKSVTATFAPIPANVSWGSLLALYTAFQGDTVAIGVNATSSAGYALTHTLNTGVLPAGVSVDFAGNLVISAGATLGMVGGLSLLANDGHGNVAASPVFSLSVEAVPVLGWRTPLPELVFDEGVAGQSINLSTFVDNPNNVPLTYSHTGTLPTGASRAASLLSYDGTSPAAFSDVEFGFDAVESYAVPDADVLLFAINDSSADGATAGSSHPLAKLPWKSSIITYPQTLKQSTYQTVGTGYGDCIGIDGQEIPTSLNYFARITLPALGTQQPVSINATSLVNFWIAGHPNWGMTLIGSAGSISNFSRRTDATVANRPTLNLVRADGSAMSVACAAHRSLIAPATGTAGADIDCTAGVGSMILVFPLTGVSGLATPVQSATLTLRGMTRGTPNTISLYATDMSYVLRKQTPVLGLANASVKDAGLVASFNADLAIAAGVDPPARPAGGVLYAETWPDISGMPSRGYYQRSGGGPPPGSNISLISGTDPENPGYTPLAPGINDVKIKMNAGMAVAMNLVWPFNGPWGYIPEHIWVRFYLMLANDWPFYDTVAGVGNVSQFKFPFAPSCHVPHVLGNSLLGKHARNAPLVSWSTPTGVIPAGGNGGDPATGACMWSMRNYGYAIGDNTGGVATAAVHGPLAMAGYWPISASDMYNCDQYGPFGDDNYWTSERTLAGLMKRNTRRCIELHVKMNSLWTAASPCPDPVYLGNVRRMPYRSPTDPLVSDQLGADTAISTHDRSLFFGNATGLRYPGFTTPIAPDTAVFNSATQYGTPSMIGVRDGIYEVYVDGVLAHRRTNLRWRHIPDASIDCLWFDYGQTQLIAGSTGSVYFAQMIAVDGDIVTGPIGPMRMS